MAQGILNRPILRKAVGARPADRLEKRFMLDPKLFYAARWGELYQFFAAGNPPLVLQLLLINTVFLVFFIVRRARNRSPLRSQAAYVVQAVLIAANAMLMFSPDFVEHTTRMLARQSSYQIPGADKDLDSVLLSIVGK